MTPWRVLVYINSKFTTTNHWNLSEKDGDQTWDHQNEQQRPFWKKLPALRISQDLKDLKSLVVWRSDPRTLSKKTEANLLFIGGSNRWFLELGPKRTCIIFPSLQSFQHPKILVSGIYVPIGSSFSIHLCHSLWVNVVPEPLLSGDSLRSRRWQLPCLLPPGPQRPTKTSHQRLDGKSAFQSFRCWLVFFDLEITSNQPNDDDIFRRTGLFGTEPSFFLVRLHPG